mmetsp:Transcript_11591/g.25534  ORF Transcript_11591/g.25534 Transcript_11591/m.25534 type:complete len:347 (-) Transcript_11591:1433-2473(-)
MICAMTPHKIMTHRLQLILNPLNLAPILDHTTSLQAPIIHKRTEVVGVQSTQPLTRNCLAPRQGCLTRLGNRNIIIRTLHFLRPNGVRITFRTSNDKVTSPRCLNSGILVEESRGVDSVVKQGLFNILLIFELFPLADLLTIVLTLLRPRVSREAVGAMLFAKGSVGCKVHEEGLQIAKWNDSLWVVTTLFLLLLVISGSMNTDLDLDKLLPLPLRQHPNVIRASLDKWSSDLIGINLRRGRHLLLCKVHPPLTTILMTLTCRSNSPGTRQTLWNPRHIKRVFANLPSSRMKEVTMHPPLGYFVVLLTHIRDADEGRDEEGTGGRVGQDHCNAILLLIFVHGFLIT